MTIRLVIADDHPLVLRALADLFEDQPDVTIVAQCTSGAEAVEAVRTHQPDVLLLDLKMTGLSGLDVLKELRALPASCRTLLLTGAATDADIARALEIGVSGLVLKDARPETVLESVRHVARGLTWFDRDALGRGLASQRQARDVPAPESTLTPRERELVKLVAEGWRNREIAEHLGITEGTVKMHLHNIYDKLGVDSRVEMVLAAQHKHLV